MGTKLYNEDLNIMLEFEDYGESNQVFVTDTARNVSGSFEACSDMGCFTDFSDTPLTTDQQYWLESSEVANWLDTVGY